MSSDAPDEPRGPRKVVVVTPAGRKRYLDVLARHLERQKDRFDAWWLLVNTADPADIGACERLAARHPDWIDTKYARESDPARGSLNIHRFLNEFCADPDAVYVRLDDDVCFLAPDFVERIVDFRVRHPEPLLVYGNIVNNAAIAWVHAKLGTWTPPESTELTYDCLCPAGWRDGRVAEHLHRAFLADLDDGRADRWTRAFERWTATAYERISVNAVCWFGRDLAEKAVEPDEELWLSVLRPRELARPNVVCGAALCVHFAFHTQREHLETRAPDVFERYASASRRDG